jgi:hypothetical protein
VHEVGIARGRAGSAPVGRQEHGQQRAAPGLGAEVVDDPAAVRDPEVAEARRRHDLRLDSRCLYPLDRVRDEAAGDVLRRARVGRGQDADLHRSARANTTGTDSARTANA